MADQPSGTGRLAVIDIARGVAIIAMAAYHATLDLGPAFYHLIEVDAVTDPALRWLARITAGTFLFLVGVSLVLAHRRGIRWRPFLRRLAIVVAAALIVTVATRLFVPDSYVRFGILHAIAAASVIGLLFLRVPVVLVAVAAIFAFAAPYFLAGSFFNHPAWLWLGLSTAYPGMFDYVPVLPWVGPTLLGIVTTRIGLSFGLDKTWSRWQPTGFVPRTLAVAGRWSLVIYLVHQPILLALFYLLALALGRAPQFAF